MSIELKLSIKSQAELNELLAAIECHYDIHNDASIEIIQPDGRVDRAEFNKTVDQLLVISRLKERIRNIGQLGDQLPKR